MEFRKSFYEILLDNNMEEINDYLLSEGKEPKPVCPIYFFPKEEQKENEKDRR